MEKHIQQILQYLISILNNDPEKYDVMFVYTPIAIVSIIIITWIIISVRNRLKEKKKIAKT